MLQADRILQTNHPNPNNPHGLHANGPATVWVRVGGTWYDCGHRLHLVRRELEEHGSDRIVSWECGLVERMVEANKSSG